MTMNNSLGRYVVTKGKEEYKVINPRPITEWTRHVCASNRSNWLWDQLQNIGPVATDSYIGYWKFGTGIVLDTRSKVMFLLKKIHMLL